MENRDIKTVEGELIGEVAILWELGSTLLQHLATRNATTCDFKVCLSRHSFLVLKPRR